jgi:hypothetical protein
MSQPSVKNNILDWHYQTIQHAIGGPRDVNEIITTIEQPMYPQLKPIEWVPYQFGQSQN